MMKIIQWLVLSSKDPNKLALTAKGFLVMIVPIVIAISPITDDQANSVIDSIQVIVEQGLFIVSAAVMVWGAIRKIALSFKGENKVVEAQERGDL